MVAISSLILAAHLLAMNFASAGPLVAAWLGGRAAARDASRRLGRPVLWGSLAALVAGGALGAGLLGIPHPALWTALRRFPPTTYWFAASELLFSGICMAAMLASAAAWRRPAVRWLLASLSASNLLYHFPPLMTVIAKLAADPTWTPERQVNRGALRGLMGRGEVFAPWAHFALASVAVAAVAALWLGGRARRRDEEHDAATTAANSDRSLAGLALGASLVQIPIGVWVVAEQSDRVRNAMLGENPVAATLLAGGVLTALWLMHTLTAIVLGDDAAALPRRAAWQIAVVAALMCGAVQQARGTARMAAPAAHSAAASSSFGSFLSSSKSPPGSLPSAISWA